MAGRRRGAKTVDPRLYRDEVNDWERGRDSRTDFYELNGHHGNTVSTQTDLGEPHDPVEYLPVVAANEKANMTQFPQNAGTMTNAAIFNDDMDTFRLDDRTHNRFGTVDQRPPSRARAPSPCHRPRTAYNAYEAADPAYDSRGDCNNFYQRLQQHGQALYGRPAMQNKLYVQPGAPVFRSGRLGAPWRHIKTCMGNLGNHIAFIDGTVKETDMKYFPPFGYIDPPETYSYNSPRLGAAAGPPSPRRMGSRTKLNTSFNQRAKKNFKYWNDERPPAMNSPAKQTITGRMLKMGVGY